MILSSHATIRPSLRHTLVSFLVHHNPFYLLSALCMLIACFALNSTLAPRTGDLAKLLVLIGTLNLYEAMLIGLGVYLIRRGMSRDGKTLLLLEAAFLLDFTFLNAEAASVSFYAGLLLNLLFVALAGVKVAVVLRGLWGSIPRRMFGLILLQLAFLLMLPSAFKWAEHRGDVTGGYFYMAWWTAGALLALHAWLGGATGIETNAQSLVRRLYTFLPLGSLVMHLLMLQWVYRGHFTTGELSPLLIGAAVALARANLAARPDLRLVRAALPAVAVLLALWDPPAVQLHPLGGAVLTLARLTFAAAYVAWVCILFLPYARQLLAGGAIAAVACTFGPDVQQVRAASGSAWDWIVASIDEVAPKTAAQWGFLAMGCAFRIPCVGRAVEPASKIRCG